MSDRVPTLRTTADLPDALAGRNLGLYLDGRRIEAKGFYNRSDDNIYSITFEVPHGLLTAEFSDESTAELWGGWRRGDMAWVKPILPGEKSAKSGRMGMVRILDILPPRAATASNGARVKVEALMPVYDGLSSTPFIAKGDDGILPIEWLDAMKDLHGH